MNKDQRLLTKDRAIREFARFGFIGTPLTDAQFETCLDMGMNEHDIFSVGSDVACGFDFKEAIEAHDVFCTSVDGYSFM